jgi:hypothetical protein
VDGGVGGIADLRLPIADWKLTSAALLLAKASRAILNRQLEIKNDLSLLRF